MLFFLSGIASAWRASAWTYELGMDKRIDSGQCQQCWYIGDAMNAVPYRYSVNCVLKTYIDIFNYTALQSDFSPVNLSASALKEIKGMPI